MLLTPGLNLEAMRSFYGGIILLLPDTPGAFRQAAQWIDSKYRYAQKVPACLDFTGEEPKALPQAPEPEDELFVWAKEYTKSIDSIRSTNAGYSNMLYKKRKTSKSTQS